MIIGSGWAGASAHHLLKKMNINSEIFETKNVVGGHSRSEKINDVIYEPNGPHIFHTSNEIVNNFVNEFGMTRKYSHQIKSRIYPKSMKGDSILLSWPPQVSELKQLDEWKHLANKKNWRITQLPNGYYQTEVNKPEDKEQWVDITRRETMEGAEAAIDGSVDHFNKKLEYIKGPKVVKTFK